MRLYLAGVFFSLAIIATPSVALDAGNYTDTGWEPNINGCSDKGVDTKNPITNFTVACNNHDYCYRTLGNSKAYCENRFYKDMKHQCDALYAPVDITVASESACNAEWYELGEHAKCGTAQVANLAASATVTLSKAPGYPVCIGLAKAYLSGVTTVAAALGKNAYKQAQQEAQLAAVEYTDRYYGVKPGAVVLPHSVNIFSESTEEKVRLRMISNLYNDELFQRNHSIPVTEDMIERALNHSYQATYLRQPWQYMVINNMLNNVYVNPISTGKNFIGDVQLAEGPLDTLATDEAISEADLFLHQMEGEFELNDYNAAAVVVAYTF